MISKKKCQIYISNCQDPYTNLAFENWLFQNKVTDQPILYLWQNKPCVIIGRAQNPWLECNLSELEKDDLEVIRRQSGGGTVYHDLGNLNYTFLCPNTQYDKAKNLKTIIDGLALLKIHASISARNDIMVNDLNKEPRKISGCAFRETKHKSFHHGTLLINADTSSLSRYLHHKQDSTITAKGVTSVRSKVINLSEINNMKDISHYENSLIKAFCQNFNISNRNIKQVSQTEILALNDISEEIRTLRSWEWRFGKTLPFEQTLSIKNIKLQLSIRKGHIESHQLLAGSLQKSHPLQVWLDTNPVYTTDTLHRIF
jgi:lipoate-protein ligase A